MINQQAVSEIVTAVGFTLWQLQVVEDVVVNHITLLHDVAPGVSRAELSAALAGRQSMTFGRLLSVLDKVLVHERTLSVTLRERLDVVKDERNWLVHRSQRDSHVMINRTGGVRDVLARISALHLEATDLLKAVQAATEAVLVARGASPEQINRDAAAIGRAWERGERHPGEVRAE